MSDHSTQVVEYRPIPSYPAYRAGNDGTIWTRRVRGSRFNRLGEWRLLKVFKKKSGHCKVILTYIGRPCTFQVHHLVLFAFGFNRPSLEFETRHLNGKPDDNRLCNICWGTHAENYEDRILHGTHSKGEKHGMSKLTEDDVHKIRYCFPELSTRKLAKKIGTSCSNVSLIRSRRAWKHLP